MGFCCHGVFISKHICKHRCKHIFFYTLFVSSFVRFYSNTALSYLHFLHFVCIILCGILFQLCCVIPTFLPTKGMEEIKLYHSILFWYDLVTLFTLYLYGKKTKKRFNDTHRWQGSRICNRLYTKFSSNFFVYYLS